MNVAHNRSMPMFSDRRVTRHLALLGGLVIAGIVLLWISGGIPATSWRLLGQLVFQLGSYWSERGVNALIPLLVLTVQAACVLAAWVLLGWGIYQELLQFRDEMSRPLQAAAPLPQHMLTTPQMSGILPPSPSGGLLLLPEPEYQNAPTEIPLAPLENVFEETLPEEKETQKTQPAEARVVTRLVARRLKNEFQLGDPFAGELPEVMREEEVLQKDAATLDAEIDESGFKLGNPFEGPGELPDVLREEERMANPLQEAEIEETTIGVDGRRTVTRRAAQEPAPEEMVSSQEDSLFLDNPFDDVSDPQSEVPTSRSNESSQGKNVTPFDVELPENSGSIPRNLLDNPFDDEASAMQALLGSQVPTDAPTVPYTQPAPMAYAAPAPPPPPSYQARPVTSSEKTVRPGASAPIRLQPIRAGAVTHPGLRRATRPNEDSHGIVTAMRQLRPGVAVPVALLLVADGMGGHSDGQYASSLVISSVRAALEPALSDPQVNADALKLLLLNAVRDANTQLFYNNEQAGHLRGTTLTGAVVLGALPGEAPGLTAHLVNVGDSRVYRHTPAQGLARVTRDHSAVEQLVEKGIISSDDRYTDPRRSQIYRCLGEKAHVEVDGFTLTLTSGDRLLLCSDGVWEMVRDPELQRMVSTPTDEPAHITSLLLQAALEGGGEDNLTAIVAFIP